MDYPTPSERGHAARNMRRGQRVAQRSDRPESGPQASPRCWRCGVDFDPTPYKEGAPCADCQLDDPDTNWVRPKRLPTDAESVVARRNEVRKLHALGYLDAEIGAKLGMKAHTAGQIRKSLGLPRNYKPDMYLWKDVEAHIEHASHMVEKRKTVKRGKPPMNFEGSGARW